MVRHPNLNVLGGVLLLLLQPLQQLLQLTLAQDASQAQPLPCSTLYGATDTSSYCTFACTIASKTIPGFTWTNGCCVEGNCACCENPGPPDNCPSTCSSMLSRARLLPGGTPKYDNQCVALLQYKDANDKPVLVTGNYCSGPTPAPSPSCKAWVKDLLSQKISIAELSQIVDSS